MHSLVAVLLFVAVLVLVIWQPGGLSIGWCRRFVQRRGLAPFGGYCLVLGSLILLRTVVTGIWR